MFRITGVGAMALLAAFVCRPARAAPVIPPGSIGSDTVAVIHTDSTLLTPEMLRTAAKTVLGPNASRVEEFVNRFQDKYDQATKAGVEGVTVVVTEAPKPADASSTHVGPKRSKSPDVVIYLQLKPDADVKAVEAAVTEDMKPVDRENAVFEERSPFLVMHEKGHDLPTADTARARLYSDAMDSVSTMAVHAAFVLNAEGKALMLKDTAAGDDTAKGMKDASVVLADSKWMTLALALGKAPALTAAADTADTGSAAKLVSAINAGLDDVKAKAANPDGNSSPVAAMALHLIAGLADGLKPTTTGTHVAVTLDTQGLSQIANLAMLFMPRPGAAGHGAAVGTGAPDAQ